MSCLHCFPDSTNGQCSIWSIVPLTQLRVNHQMCLLVVLDPQQNLYHKETKNFVQSICRGLCTAGRRTPWCTDRYITSRALTVVGPGVNFLTKGVKILCRGRSQECASLRPLYPVLLGLCRHVQVARDSSHTRVPVSLRQYVPLSLDTWPH